MEDKPIGSLEEALLRAVNAANTNRVTLQEVMDDNNARVDEDVTEALALAEADEEAAMAYLNENSPKCPGCKQAFAFQRQAKRPDLCSWCGYNHRTGEVAGFVPA